MSEIRRYKITGFRDDKTKIRVVLEDAPLVKEKEETTTAMEIMKNPMKMANNMMDRQMATVIKDSFSISRSEYLKNTYMIGEIVNVTIEKE